ncbi:MAG: phosphoribosyltransferase [Gammaproteobacteria bacterium]|jgi:predicted phosphoribosyltransferase|nr:phosphoribosyltransferase [Gammaproteobacteria bacterium]
MKLFKDRPYAGKILADMLNQYADNPNTLILALPRGGVPVAFEVAKRLHLPMDVWLVRKLGHPQNKELAIGAISLGYVKVFNEELLKSFAVSPIEISKIVAEEEIELDRRNRRYRDSRPIPRLSNKTLVLIDDGVATGATMRAAITALRKFNPAKIIAAVPVGSTEACQELEAVADELICLYTPEPFGGVGAWYENFAQVNDLEVNDYLKKAQSYRPAPQAYEEHA